VQMYHHSPLSIGADISRLSRGRRAVPEASPFSEGVAASGGGRCEASASSAASISCLIYSVEALHLLAFLHHPETDDSAALELPVASRLEQGR
jgi:hypothetical protein